MKHIIRAAAEKKFLILPLCLSMRIGTERISVKLTLSAATLILLATCSSDRAQILNGSFESPVVTNLSVLGLGVAPGITIFTSGGGITNWTISNGDVSLVNGSAALTSSVGLFTANAGNQYAVLNGLAETTTVVPLGVNVMQTGSAGTLSQTFTTMPGKTYQLSFAYRGLGIGALNGNPIVDVGLTNANSSTAPVNGTLTANISLNSWQTDTFSFVATGSNSTLSFYQDNSGPSVGLVGLDNVTLTALPEPWQYGVVAMAFLGMLIGGRVWSQGFEKIRVES